MATTGSSAWGGNAADFAIKIAQAKKAAGWTADSISPGVLSVPSPFLDPDEVVRNAKATPSAASTVKPVTVEDFMTEPVALNDPKLGSRRISSAPTTLPKTVGASISAYGNFQAPAFLTDAVNRLNQSQTSAARLQDEYRQQLLDAVLGGNYLAAEALRAASVVPGSSVSFGQAVTDPTVGKAYAEQAKAAAAESGARTDEYTRVTNETSDLENRLKSVTEQLGSMPFGGSSIPGANVEQGNLLLEQFNIKRELDRQRDKLAQGGGYRPSGFASAP
jgi:hypothetical protein